jgi:hypothetical protein
MKMATCVPVRVKTLSLARSSASGVRVMKRVDLQFDPTVEGLFTVECSEGWMGDAVVFVG